MMSHTIPDHIFIWTKAMAGQSQHSTFSSLYIELWNALSTQSNTLLGQYAIP